MFARKLCSSLSLNYRHNHHQLPFEGNTCIRAAYGSIRVPPDIVSDKSNSAANEADVKKNAKEDAKMKKSSHAWLNRPSYEAKEWPVNNPMEKSKAHQWEGITLEGEREGEKDDSE